VLAALLRDASSSTTVADHAHRLGLSVAALRDAVRRATGYNPKEYLLLARLNRAKELLATTDLTVAAVARHTGYDDPAHFTRVFTRRVGVPPSRFRRQQQRGSADPGG
jgi:AraC-like DNA-binding protein